MIKRALIARLNKHPVIFGVLFVGAIASILTFVITLNPSKRESMLPSVAPHDVFDGNDAAQASHRDSNLFPGPNIGSSTPTLILPTMQSLPHLALGKSPILDSTLFVAYDYQDFVLGGKNLNQIKIAARSLKGDSVSIGRGYSDEYLRIHKYDGLFIEIEYKGKFYSIKVITTTNLGSQFTVREISSLTMTLEDIPPEG